MRKNVICLALCAMLFALCDSASAQYPAGKIPRIGVLNAGASSSIPARLGAFRQGLRDLGYIEGQNIIIELPYAEGKLDRLPDVAAEFVRIKVEVIVTTGTTGALAAKKATSTIPIVMTTGADPVAMGLIASLARPGGNITGLTSVSTDLAGKRLELLKETVPRLTRVGILWNPADPGSTAVFKETETWPGRWGCRSNPWRCGVPMISRVHSKQQLGNEHTLSLSCRLP